jgi:hypothetical protein
MIFQKANDFSEGEHLCSPRQSEGEHLCSPRQSEGEHSNIILTLNFAIM